MSELGCSRCHFRRALCGQGGFTGFAGANGLETIFAERSIAFFRHCAVHLQASRNIARMVVTFGWYSRGRH
jgi:hypothetical protein